MRLALALGDEQAVSMPVAAAANEVNPQLPSPLLWGSFAHLTLGDSSLSAVLQEGEELGAGRGGLLRGVRGAQGLVCRRRGVMQPVGLFCIPLPSRALEPR